MKPFSTYPEDRDTLIALSNIIQRSNDQEEIDKASNKLSDLVLAILRDEEVYEFDFGSDELSMIDAAWESHKNAKPVAKIINDNQPGRTAIVEILEYPPTIGVGTILFRR